MKDFFKRHPRYILLGWFPPVWIVGVPVFYIGGIVSYIRSARGILDIASLMVLLPAGLIWPLWIYKMMQE